MSHKWSLFTGNTQVRCDTQSPRPAEHERDPSVRRTRINEAGDAVPGSQDSITRGVRNQHFAGVPAAQPDQVNRAPSTMPNPRRLSQERSRHQRAFLWCAQCGADPQAFVGSTDPGLMIHMGQKHGGQSLIRESVAELRQLDRAACVICGTIRSRRGNHCNHCRADSATRDIFVGDVFQGALDDSPLPNSPLRDIVITERDTQLLADLRAAMATPHSIVSRYPSE